MHAVATHQFLKLLFCVLLILVLVHQHAQRTLQGVLIIPGVVILVVGAVATISRQRQAWQRQRSSCCLVRCLTTGCFAVLVCLGRHGGWL